MLSTMLPQVDDWNARRRVIAARYADGIRHPDIVLPPLGGDDDTVHLYVVRCDRREALRRHLADAGIASDIHYPNPDHRPVSYTHLDVYKRQDDDTVHLYVVRCDRREALRRHLADAGIASDIHYPTPDHRQPCHRGRYEAVNLPETERDANRVLTLPCFAEMTEDEILRVIQACNRF